MPKTTKPSMRDLGRPPRRPGIETPRRPPRRPGPAWFATAAIALAFLCSLTGFVIFLTEAPEMHDLHHELILHTIVHPGKHGEKHADKDKEEAKKNKDADQGKYNLLKGHWEGHLE